MPYISWSLWTLNLEGTGSFRTSTAANRHGLSYSGRLDSAGASILNSVGNPQLIIHGHSLRFSLHSSVCTFDI